MNEKYYTQINGVPLADEQARRDIIDLKNKDTNVETDINDLKEEDILINENIYSLKLKDAEIDSTISEMKVADANMAADIKDLQDKKENAIPFDASKDGEKAVIHEATDKSDQSIATGYQAIAFGGRRYDKRFSYDKFKYEPTTAEGSQSLAIGGGQHAYGGFSIAANKDCKSYLKASSSFGGSNQAGPTFEEWKASTGKDSKDEYDSQFSFAFATGETNKALGRQSFVTGNSNVIEYNAPDSFASGSGNKTSGAYSAIEGLSNIIENDNRDPENKKISNAAHAEGTENRVFGGFAAHAEGASNEASGRASHVEGTDNISSGDYSHAQGTGNITSGVNSMAGGSDNVVSGLNSTSFGNHNVAAGNNQFVIGSYNANDNGNLFEIGNGNSDSDRYNIFGVNRVGDVNISGVYKKDGIEIKQTDVTLNGEHRDTFEVTSKSDATNITNGTGTFSIISQNDHDDRKCIASGDTSLAIGGKNSATKDFASAFGCNTSSKGWSSMTTGYGTTSEYDNQLVQGKFNDNKAINLFEVGNGFNNDVRRNAFEVDTEGNATLMGDMLINKNVSMVNTIDDITERVSKLETSSPNTFISDTEMSKTKNVPINSYNKAILRYIGGRTERKTDDGVHYYLKNNKVKTVRCRSMNLINLNLEASRKPNKDYATWDYYPSNGAINVKSQSNPLPYLNLTGQIPCDFKRGEKFCFKIKSPLDYEIGVHFIDADNADRYNNIILKPGETSKTVVLTEDRGKFFITLYNDAQNKQLNFSVIPMLYRYVNSGSADIAVVPYTEIKKSIDIRDQTGRGLDNTYFDKLDFVDKTKTEAIAEFKFNNNRCYTTDFWEDYIDVITDVTHGIDDFHSIPVLSNMFDNCTTGIYNNDIAIESPELHAKQEAEVQAILNDKLIIEIPMENIKSYSIPEYDYMLNVFPGGYIDFLDESDNLIDVPSEIDYIVHW